MNTIADWDPRSPDVQTDPIGAYDAMRQRCPFAHNDASQLLVLGHADVMRILMDPEIFSSQASRHVSVPNSMDPPEHSLYRSIIEPYFDAMRMAQFAPLCQALCEELVMQLPMDGEVELMSALAHPFSLQTQCAFLGWPDTVHQPLHRWVHRKNAATLSGDHDALAAVAVEFDETIRALLAARREAGDEAPDDATTRLMRETVADRPLTETEIVSILRNWTVGELGTIASSVGIIADYLASRPQLQQDLRDQPSLISAANDEILRIYAPLISNRRRATRRVCLGTETLQAGDRLSLIWASANRDETVFGDPDEFRPDRDPTLNLLYGAGIHACPGAPLARLELRTIIETLLSQTLGIARIPGRPPSVDAYPSSGYRTVPLHITRR
ncbi:MAG: cytochrome P450 [Candidimonas sp.]|nr:MAG: cytochrome P450 [Candidimonas sp.]TAM22428.1 MAG: cytochrome P450 [Candidimonas sp.]